MFLQCSRILLLGRPGVGKSILGCKIALDWSDIIDGRTKTSGAKLHGMEPVQSTNLPQDIPSSQSKNVTQDIPSDQSRDMTESELNFLQQFSLLLHIDLSRVRPNSNLCDVISEQILVDQGWNLQQSVQSLINYMHKFKQKVMLILDGWDSFNPMFCPEITEIVNRRSFPDATVLITSRIREGRVMPKAVQATFMIKGFNLKQAKQFIAKVFHLIKFTASGDDLVNFVTDHYLWELYSAPLMLTYLCLLYSNGLPFQDKITNLFCSMANLILKTHELKTTKTAVADVIVTFSDFHDVLCDLGKLAYFGLKDNNTQTVFSEEEVIKIGGEAILDVGLLHKITSGSPSSQSCLFRFENKSMQEFLAAVYVCNDEAAFSKYCRFLPFRSTDSAAFSQFHKVMDSLTKVYDWQLLLAFVCGLNAHYGQKLINKIQHISYTSDTDEAAQCELSSKRWHTVKPSGVNLAYRQGITPSDVTHLLVQYCWEMTRSIASAQNRKGFPFRPVSSWPAIKLKPNINMNMINMHHLTQLLQTSKVVFSEGGEIMLYNLSHNKENNKHIATLLDHISHNMTNVSYINITNMNSDTHSESLPGIFNTISKDVMSVLFNSDSISRLLFYKGVVLNNLHLHPSDMLEVLRRLPKDVVMLNVDNVNLSGCEASLCKTLTHLISLEILYLGSLPLPGYEKKMCEAISGLKKLKLLSLDNTNMAAAEEALLICLKTLRLLTYLDLADTQLTEDTTRAVIDLLPSWPGLVYLSLMGLPVSETTEELRQGLPQLINLRWLDVRSSIRRRLNTQQLVKVFSSLPQRVQVVCAHGEVIQDDIRSITQKLPSLPDLQYLFLPLHSVSTDITQQLKPFFQQKGAVIISSEEDYIEHRAGLYSIINDIHSMYI